MSKFYTLVLLIEGLEITSDLMDDPQLSLIAEQVSNGVAIRMAFTLFNGNTKDG